jgi:hypothetical protein
VARGGRGGADGTPLGARPGQVLAVPPHLSNSGEQGTTCDPANPGSVYVTFPSCQLVAEVDLRTQRILQSRQFVRDPDTGAIDVVDTGSNPVCPIDCAEQFLDPQYADARWRWRSSPGRATPPAASTRPT